MPKLSGELLFQRALKLHQILRKWHAEGPHFVGLLQNVLLERMQTVRPVMGYSEQQRDLRLDVLERHPVVSSENPPTEADRAPSNHISCQEMILQLIVCQMREVLAQLTMDDSLKFDGQSRPQVPEHGRTGDQDEAIELVLGEPVVQFLDNRLGKATLRHADRIGSRLDGMARGALRFVGPTWTFAHDVAAALVMIVQVKPLNRFNRSNAAGPADGASLGAVSNENPRPGLS